MIKEKDGKYYVYDKAGAKVLGEHDTEKDALRQLRAIEVNKDKDEDK